jgi:hypothetical protein
VFPAILSDPESAWRLRNVPGRRWRPASLLVAKLNVTRLSLVLEAICAASATRGTNAAAIGTNPDQTEGLYASPNSGAGLCSSSTTEGPYLQASSARICPADSVTEALSPVSVTTARWPGSGSVVS